MNLDLSLLLEEELVTHYGRKIRLRDEKAEALVVYFYPRAMTPGCTREAQRFNELLEEFKKCGVKVYGVSTDPPERNRRFKERYGLGFTLLSDSNGKLASKLGILKKGTKKPSAERTTFIVKGGKIVEILRNIRPAEKHADLALEKVKSLLGC